MEEPWPLWLRAGVAALLVLEAVLGLSCNVLVLAAGGACGRCRASTGNGARSAQRRGLSVGGASWGGAGVGGRGSAVSVSVMVTASVHALDLLISVACAPVAAAALLLPVPTLLPRLVPVPFYPGVPPTTPTGAGVNRDIIASTSDAPAATPSIAPSGCREAAGAAKHTDRAPRRSRHGARTVHVTTGRSITSSLAPRPTGARAKNETENPITPEEDRRRQRGWRPGGRAGNLYALHEACASFAGVATSTGVLLVTLDRYDMGVRPTSRLLTPRRAGAVLAALWALSAAAFACPLMRPDWILQQPNRRGPNVSNRIGNDSIDDARFGCGGGCRGGSEIRLQFNHLVPQAPVFLLATGAMLLTYGKIVRALRFRFASGLHSAGGASTKPTAQTPAAPTLEPARKPVPMGVHTSVAVVLAIKRAVRRHRERRARKRRVLRTSLAIVGSFAGCWAPVQTLNLVLATTAGSANSDEGLALALRVRPALLALAYATAALHPALYGFTRQGVREAIAAALCRCPASPTAGAARPRFRWWGRRVSDGAGRPPGWRAERGLPDGAEGEEGEGLRGRAGVSVSPERHATPDPVPGVLRGGRALARLRVEVTQLSDTTERCVTEIVTTRE